MSSSLELPPLVARRIIRRDQRGSSSPIVVETDGGPFVVKLRGAAQGTAALVAEVIVGALADQLGLAVPERRLVQLAAETPTDDRNDELADLLAASHGENLGFRFLPTARSLAASDLEHLPREWAARVRWLDWLVLNPDRTAKNPNILVDGRHYWLIDHGAALWFQHDWAAVTEQSPHRAEWATSHLFDPICGAVELIGTAVVDRLSREQLSAATAVVPDSFLMPLLGRDASREALERRRAAYATFLWKRQCGTSPILSDGDRPV